MCEIIINITWEIVRELCRGRDCVIGTAKTIGSGSSLPGEYLPRTCSLWHIVRSRY
jgi:hypothetical protein